MSYRIERFSSTLKQCLADILLNEIDNPHLKSISITEVVVSSDLKKARIFVDSTKHNPADLIPELTGAKGFIKKSLAKKMYLRYVPELIFFKNENYEIENEKKSC
ncbi:MAG: 30S ribosome-binding factor RbfA [Candidatus Aminicenantes bacterium]|nr:30S ribosome-binding factor RbfA [Candidatus Aminicenantes bacterium]